VFRPKTKYVALPSPRAGIGEEIDRLTCPKCDTSLEPARLAAALRVCYRCGYHFRLRASERITMLLEPGSFQEHDRGLFARDVLGFKDSQPYGKRIEQSRANTGVDEAVTWGEGTLAGHRLIVVCFDFAFMGGSMGAATGEKITNGIEHALDHRLPLLIISASGGARMQEGMFSLMQMAKTSAAIGRLGAAGLPYFSLLTDPTMGGVTASFATLADVILAEPGAMIGFAGARVIQQATYETLPDGFQTAEFLWQRGMIDLVVPRPELPAVLRQLLDLYVKNAVTQDLELPAKSMAGARASRQPIPR
jgi:acetyl-CoA carboxylase carboxyl transferase beta subunit